MSKPRPSTRSYFQGRAYITSPVKSPARDYFWGRSYFRGNTVVGVGPGGVPSGGKLPDKKLKIKILCTGPSDSLIRYLV